jgi:hypothetical protein
VECIPPATVHDLADTFRTLSVAGQLAGYVAPHRFFEVGSASGVEALEEYLSRQSLCVQPGGEGE